MTTYIERIVTMRRMMLKIPAVTAFASVFMLAMCINCFAQDSNPVRIGFEKRSDRIDIMTGKELPDYTRALQGSFQFFTGRLDEPDTFIYYFHDGRRRVEVSDLASMKKDQGRFAIWNLVWKSGRGLHPAYGPRIHHLAVSFIPLNPETKKPEKRVYLLLNDLRLITWEDSAEDTTELEY
jgi:hypothetical protein